MMPPLPVAPPPERRMAGIALRIGSASCFAVMGVLLKLGSVAGVSAPEMIFYRSLFGLPLILGWIAAGPGLAAARSARPSLHVTRGAIGMLSMLLTFEALVLLPLAEATTITFTAPVFATLFSVLVLGERIGRHRWFAVLLGFVGVIVVMRPGGSSASVPLVGVLVALGAAVGQSAVAITVRRMAQQETVAATVLWFAVIGTVVGAAMLPAFGRMHGPGTFALLAAAGLLGGVAQVMMTMSLRFAPVAVVAPFDYVQMLWAIGLGWALLATIPTATTLVGAALIAASGLYTLYREHRRRRLLATLATPV